MADLTDNQMDIVREEIINGLPSFDQKVDTVPVVPLLVRKPTFWETLKSWNIHDLVVIFILFLATANSKIRRYISDKTKIVNRNTILCICALLMVFSYFIYFRFLRKYLL